MGKGKILASSAIYITHGLNSPNEWYAKNRRGYRK